MKNSYKIIFIIGIIYFIPIKLSAQDWNTGGNNIGANEYLGGDATSTIPLELKTKTAFPINFYTNNSANPYVTILGSTNPGYVGIGAISPASLLHLNKSGSTEVKTRITNGNNTNGLQVGVETNGNGTVNMTDNFALNFYTDDTKRMHFNDGSGATAGFCAIGNFSTPQSRLHLKEGANDGWLQITTSNTGGSSPAGSNGLRIGVIESSKNVEIKQQEAADMLFYTNAAERMRILSGGNVGIGLAAPQNLVHQHIASNGNTYHQFTTSRSGSGSGNVGFKIGITDRSSTAEVDINQQENAYMRFYTSANERMAIGNTGNVGIGVVAPNARLDVDNDNNSNTFSAEITNSATGYGAVTVGLVTGTNSLSRSSGINHGIDLRIYGNQNINEGLNVQVDEDYASATNYGAEFNAYRGSINKGVIGVGANDNNNAGSASENYGVVGVARDASTYNYALHGNATGSGATNYGIIAAASGGATNYAGYFNGNVYATGTITSSDSILKTNVQQINNALQVISQLNPKTYNFKSKVQLNADMNLPSGIHAGLIAQEVMSVLPGIVSTNVQPALKDANGNTVYPALEFKGIAYEELIPYLIGAVKELKAQLDAIQPLAPGGTGSVLRNNGSQNVTLDNSTSPILYQNEPNPFSNQTKIKYFIPENTGNAALNFYNNMGTVIKSVTISQKGQGTVEVDTANLNSAIYTYSLTIDGQVIDTKRMVKTK